MTLQPAILKQRYLRLVSGLVVCSSLILPLPLQQPRPALAQSMGIEVMEVITPARIERILSSFSDITYRSNGDRTYLLTFDNGTKVLLRVGEKTLLLQAGWEKKGISLGQINEWNREKRFAKAYLDKVNDPILESDYELTGGVTEANIKEWMKTYVYFLKEFQKYINV